MTDIHNRPSLLGHRVTLRAVQAGDEEFLIKAGRHAEISKMFGEHNPVDRAISRSDAEGWLASQIETPLAWVIAQAGTLIGALRFHSHKADDRRASFAIGLFSLENFDKGLGSEAMSLAFQHGFDALNLHRITPRVLHFNARAIAAYQKLGFEIEGRERQSARIGGEWHDDIIMGLIAPEFTAKKAA